MTAGQKNPIVGRFWERVGHKIIGGELERNANGDICRWDKSLTVEVKSSGHASHYGFRIDLGQLEKNEQLNSFLFSRKWYMFFVYRNKSVRKNGHRSEMAPYVSPSEIRRYLARRAMHCLVLDLSIIQRVREFYPHSTMSVLGHPGTPTVDLVWRRAYTFTNGGVREELLKLGLEPQDYGILRGQVRVSIREEDERHRVRMPLAVVVPRAQKRFARKLFSEREGVELD